MYLRTYSLVVVYVAEFSSGCCILELILVHVLCVYVYVIECDRATLVELWTCFHFQGGYDAGYLYKCKFIPNDDVTKPQPDVINEPLLAVPVSDSIDIPISAVRFRSACFWLCLPLCDSCFSLASFDV